jgi:hypothetical protein
VSKPQPISLALKIQTDPIDRPNCRAHLPFHHCPPKAACICAFFFFRAPLFLLNPNAVSSPTSLVLCGPPAEKKNIEILDKRDKSKNHIYFLN